MSHLDTAESAHSLLRLGLALAKPRDMRGLLKLMICGAGLIGSSCQLELWDANGNRNVLQFNHNQGYCFASRCWAGVGTTSSFEVLSEQPETIVKVSSTNPEVLEVTGSYSEDSLRWVGRSAGFARIEVFSASGLLDSYDLRVEPGNEIEAKWGWGGRALANSTIGITATLKNRRGIFPITVSEEPATLLVTQSVDNESCHLVSLGSATGMRSYVVRSGPQVGLTTAVDLVVYPTSAIVGLERPYQTESPIYAGLATSLRLALNDGNSLPADACEWKLSDPRATAVPQRETRCTPGAAILFTSPNRNPFDATCVVEGQQWAPCAWSLKHDEKLALETSETFRLSAAFGRHNLAARLRNL